MSRKTVPIIVSLILFACLQHPRFQHCRAMTLYLDQIPPEIGILSPETKSYATNSVPLTFTLNEELSWIGYTVDGQENTTTTGNTTLNIAEGLHWVKVYANDTEGNVGFSGTISFMVDTTSPSITTLLRSPSGDIQPDQSVMISVNVTDTGSGVESVRLAYFTNRSTVGLEFPMMLNQTSGLYERTILVQEASTLVRYRITAYDNAGNNATNDNAGDYYVYTVVPEFPSLLILPLFIAVTLLAIIDYGIRRSRCLTGNDQAHNAGVNLSW